MLNLFILVILATVVLGKRRVLLKYYNEEGCKNLVGMTEFLEGDSYNLQGSVTDSCATNLACLADKDSAACKAASAQKPEGRESVISTVAVTFEDGVFLETDNNEVAVHKSDDCKASSVFHNCFFQYVEAEELSDHDDEHAASKALNPNGAGEPDATDPKTIVLAYYADDHCEHPVSIRTFLAGEEYPQMGSVGGDCAQATQCEHPFSQECAELRKTSIATWVVTDHGETFTDKNTLADGEDGKEYKYDGCYPSGRFFRYARHGSDKKPWLIDEPVKRSGWKPCMWRYVPLSEITKDADFLTKKFK